MLHQYEAIEKEIKDNSDINIVFFEKFNIGEKDYKMAISKANARKPDMYLISGYNPSVYLFLKQLKEITGRNDNVTSVDVFTEISPENMYMADGLWYVDSQLMGSKEFQKRLKEEAVLTSQSCTGNTVSNLEILVDAFENAKVDEGDVLPSKDNVREYIFANTHNKNTASGEANIINDGLIVVEPRIEVIDASWFLSGGRR
jgi:ABC-type branched-subunit amino acid transport system substrate-binding protein